MTVKTYSRARTAKAAALKILAMHEVPEATYNLVIEEPTLDRFSAKVEFHQIPEEGVQDDLTAAGITTALLDNPVAKEPAILELNPGSADVAYPAPAPVQEDEKAWTAEGQALLNQQAQAAREAAEAAAAQALLDEEAAMLATLKPAKPQRAASEVKAPKGQGVVATAWAVFGDNPGLSRKDAVAAAVALGINPATARTQYQKWYTANKSA